MHTLWYVSVEWQMTAIVAPILIYLLWRFGNKIVPLIASIAIISSLYAAKIAYDNAFIARDFDM
jgi:peptidoglycan/LPS O-acetylase OafA/YrhL